MAAVTVLSDSILSPIYDEMMEWDAMILVFWMLSFKPVVSLSSFTLMNRLFSSSFCYKGSFFCMSEVADISAGKLDSSLWITQSSISHDVFFI